MLDSFEALKHSQRTNEYAWLRRHPIVSYGFITETLDSSNVRVEQAVQDEEGVSVTHDVTLLGLTSELFELRVQPKAGDLVLLFSLNKFDGRMFDNPESRPEDGRTLVNTDLNGYSTNSMVGILASTFKAASAVSVSVEEDAGENMFSMSSSAKSSMAFMNSASFTFTSPDGDELPVNITVGAGRPVKVERRSPLTERVGFLRSEEDGDEEDVLLPSPTEVRRSSEAPYSLTTEASTELNFGVREESSAPVNITAGEDAPITVDTLSPVNITAGEGAPIAVDTLSPVNITAGEDAPITIDTKADINLTIDSSSELNINLGNGILTLGNGTDTIGGLLTAIIDILKSFKTTGSPAAHVTDPSVIGDLVQLQSTVDRVLG